MCVSAASPRRAALPAPRAPRGRRCRPLPPLRRPPPPAAAPPSCCCSACRSPRSPHPPRPTAPAAPACPRGSRCFRRGAFARRRRRSRCARGVGCRRHLRVRLAFAVLLRCRAGLAQGALPLIRIPACRCALRRVRWRLAQKSRNSAPSPARTAGGLCRPWWHRRRYVAAQLLAKYRRFFSRNRRMFSGRWVYPGGCSLRRGTAPASGRPRALGGGKACETGGQRNASCNSCRVFVWGTVVDGSKPENEWSLPIGGRNFNLGI